MLEVRNLHAKIGDKEILKGINLTVKDGETHAIMGPNGSGKSTLSAVLVGNPMFEVTDGTAVFNGKDLLEMKPEDRANEGIFLSFQYPVEIPGVSMTNFMRTAINEKRKYQGLEPMSAADFIKLMKEKRQIVELDAKLSQRSVNEGFSGGEKNVATANLFLGVGVKYKLADRLNLGLEWAMHFAMSDKLDGVSDPYTVGSVGMFKNKDGYSAISLSLTYSFMPKCRTCNKDD